MKISSFVFFLSSICLKFYLYIDRSGDLLSDLRRTTMRLFMCTHLMCFILNDLIPWNISRQKCFFFYVCVVCLRVFFVSQNEQLTYLKFSFSDSVICLNIHIDRNIYYSSSFFSYKKFRILFNNWFFSLIFFMFCLLLFKWKKTKLFSFSIHKMKL